MAFALALVIIVIAVEMWLPIAELLAFSNGSLFFGNPSLHNL